jgi:ribosomal protein L37AE/L43A
MGTKSSPIVRALIDNMEVIYWAQIEMLARYMMTVAMNRVEHPAHTEQRQREDEEPNCPKCGARSNWLRELKGGWGCHFCGHYWMNKKKEKQ